VKYMDFLLPDLTHETFKGRAADYGDFLCELFDEWVRTTIRTSRFDAEFRHVADARGGSWVDATGTKSLRRSQSEATAASRRMTC